MVGAKEVLDWTQKKTFKTSFILTKAKMPLIYSNNLEFLPIFEVVTSENNFKENQILRQSIT